jgi:hypothetical protein
MSDKPEDDADRLRHDPVLVAVEDAAEAVIAAANQARDASLCAAEAVDRLAFDKTYDSRAKGNGHREPFKGKPRDKSADDKPLPPSRVIGAGTFMRSYEAISYTIDGVLPSGCLYGLTAKPGTGKTAGMIAATLAVACLWPSIQQKTHSKPS